MIAKTISTETAARLLKVSRRKVLLLIEHGKLRARVVGEGAWAIYYGSVLDYMQRQERTP